VGGSYGVLIGAATLCDLAQHCEAGRIVVNFAKRQTYPANQINPANIGD
jgi:hypothetical protein